MFWSGYRFGSEIRVRTDRPRRSPGAEAHRGAPPTSLRFRPSRSRSRSDPPGGRAGVDQRRLADDEAVDAADLDVRVAGPRRREERRRGALAPATSVALAGGGVTCVIATGCASRAAVTSGRGSATSGVLSVGVVLAVSVTRPRRACRSRSAHAPPSSRCRDGGRRNPRRLTSSRTWSGRAPCASWSPSRFPAASRPRR
jgi:hypothetical protein